MALQELVCSEACAEEVQASPRQTSLGTIDCDFLHPTSDANSIITAHMNHSEKLMVM